MKTCAFTGHRPQNLPWQFNEADINCLKLKQILNQQISQLAKNGFRFSQNSPELNSGEFYLNWTISFGVQPTILHNFSKVSIVILTYIISAHSFPKWTIINNNNHLKITGYVNYKVFFIKLILWLCPQYGIINVSNLLNWKSLFLSTLHYLLNLAI